MMEAPLTVESSGSPEMVLFKVLTLLENVEKMKIEEFIGIPGLSEHPDAGKILDSASADGVIEVDEENGFVTIDEFGRAVANDIRQSMEGQKIAGGSF